MLEHHRDVRRQRGFTLAEVLVATAIFAVIVIAALMIYDRSNRVFKESVEAASMQQETRVAFDKLVRDVRMAGFDFDRDGVPLITTPTVWAPSTAYLQNRYVIPTTPNGFVYIAVNGGTSHTTEPPHWSTTVGELTNDNDIKWRAIKAVYQQPDEQVEFAGMTAITIRGNLDYTSDATAEHGREARDDASIPTYDYEPAGGEFPIVTTGNDEIVTYALKSDAPGAPNDDEIHFFADVARPRTAFPGAGGAAESEVIIRGVDLCDDTIANGEAVCEHPPYTLYRFTIQPNGQPDAGTPVASNIRSLKFFYYTSSLGAVGDTNPADGVVDELLRSSDNNPLNQGAIGGLGQYDPNDVGGTDDFGDRAQRESIASIRVQLVGMSAAKDVRYVNPSEASTSPARNFRTYQLESLVVPRNAGLRGMEEPVSIRPTPPKMRSICHGHCKATRVIWDAPTSGGVTAYEVRYGTTWTTSNRALPNLATFQDGSPARVPGDQLVAYVILPDPPSSTEWYVNVRAINEHGPMDADNYLRSGGSRNKTKPAAVTNLEAANEDDGNYEPNRIRLEWPRVRLNDTSNASYHTLACTTGGDTNGTAIPAQENIRYRIWRSTDPNFDPAAGQGVKVLDAASTIQPPISGATTTVVWYDDAASIFGQPPANCVTYYYRIQAYDDCLLASENDPANARLGESAIFPAIGDPGIEGYAGYNATTPTTPAAPASFTIDSTNSRCRVGPNDCTIALTWGRVNQDTVTPTANTISVDKYVIDRERRTAAAPSWVADPLTDNEFDGQSLTTGTTVSFTDTTARHHVPGSPSQRYYYRYRVRATNCSAVSAWTAWEDYPDVCPSGSTPASSATSGSGAPGDPYMMSAGDFIQITPAATVTVSRVDFQLLDMSVDPPVEVTTVSVSTAPYIFAWEAGMPEDIEFKLAVTVVQASGCVEEFDIRVQEDPGLCPAAVRTVRNANGGAGVSVSPYVMNAGDEIELSGPADATLGVLTLVSFQLFQADGTTPVGAAVVDNSGPGFVYQWVDRVDGLVYRLRPTVVFDSGCTETLDDIFIRDETCSGATTTATGSLSGNGTAVGTPWVMAAGATITVTPPAAATPQRVLFDVQAVNAAGDLVGTAEPTVSDGAAPWQFTWANRVDETTYRVSITVIYSTGCQETLVRYVKDDPAACRLELDNPDGTLVSITNPDDDAVATIALHNQGTAVMTLTSLAITWNRWDAGITWNNVVFPSTDTVAVNSTASETRTISLAGLTAAEKEIAAGATMSLTLNFTESGNRAPMEESDITRVCVSYTRADTGSRVYACRILDYPGPDASPNNPTSCN